MTVIEDEDQVQIAETLAEEVALLRSLISAVVRVPVPLRRAMGEWSRFDEFPHFMRGPEQAHKVDGSRMVWRIHFDGGWVPWDAETIHMHADDGFFWRNQAAERPCPNWGRVSLVPESPTMTRIDVACEFAPLAGQRWPESSMKELAARLQRGLSGFQHALSRCGSEPADAPPAGDPRRVGWLALPPAARHALEAVSGERCPFSVCPG